MNQTLWNLNQIIVTTICDYDCVLCGAKALAAIRHHDYGEMNDNNGSLGKCLFCSTDSTSGFLILEHKLHDRNSTKIIFLQNYRLPQFPKIVKSNFWQNIPPLAESWKFDNFLVKLCRFRYLLQSSAPQASFQQYMGECGEVFFSSYPSRLHCVG